MAENLTVGIDLPVGGIGSFAGGHNGAEEKYLALLEQMLQRKSSSTGRLLRRRAHGLAVTKYDLSGAPAVSLALMDEP